MSQSAVVIPNLNGKEDIGECIDSLLKQNAQIIVVENGSTDNSLEFIKSNFPEVQLIVNKVNKGFTAVNQGIKKAIDEGYDYVALFNNDALADRDWLKHLVNCLDNNAEVGIATCKFLSYDGDHIDSTGDIYSNWGLSYPRGRGERVSTKYDNKTDVFGATGGASIYRISMLKEIGLFDEDFFAYFEDVDISFRAQLAGWKVKYVPDAIAYHRQGATSKKMKGFTTYNSIKNIPWVWYKNVPNKYLFSVGIRVNLALVQFIGRAFTRGQGIYAVKGFIRSYMLFPKKQQERRRIQSSKKVSDDYIWSIIVHDLPPNARALRKIRGVYWKITGKKDV
jgi:GT2 family glycosyltransferase